MTGRMTSQTQFYPNMIAPVFLIFDKFALKLEVLCIPECLQTRLVSDHASSSRHSTQC